MNTPKTPFAAQIVAVARDEMTAPIDADPYALLDELMVVVEALCPEWPERPIFKDGGRMLL